MRRITAYLVAGIMIVTLAACSAGSTGGTDNNSGDPAENPSGSNAYVVEVAELDAKSYPDNYPLIDSGDFEAAFENLKAANLSGELNEYQDVADIFGVDGAYYVNNDYDAGGEIFKYYGWYAENGVSVLITFKAEGDQLNYKAYTGSGIS